MGAQIKVRPFYLVLAFQLCKRFGVSSSELLKCSLVNGIAYLLGECVVEVQIMLYSKSACKLFVCLEQMADVCTGEVTAGRAVTFLVNRSRVCLVALVVQVHDTAPREYSGMTGITARHYAVEHINASCNSLNDI